MARKKLEEQLAKAEERLRQLKAKKQRAEALKRAAEAKAARAAETQQKLQAGELVKRAGALEWDRELLLGALLHELESIGRDPSRREKLRAKGAAALVSMEAEHQRKTVPAKASESTPSASEQQALVGS